MERRKTVRAFLGVTNIVGKYFPKEFRLAWHLDYRYRLLGRFFTSEEIRLEEEESHRLLSERLSRDEFNRGREATLPRLYAGIKECLEMLDYADIHRPKTFDEYSRIHLRISDFWQAVSTSQKWLYVINDDSAALGEVLEMFKEARGVFYFSLPPSERRFESLVVKFESSIPQFEQYMPEATPKPAHQIDWHKLNKAADRAEIALEGLLKHPPKQATPKNGH
jgi:hypothetical protein